MNKKVIGTGMLPEALSFHLIQSSKQYSCGMHIREPSHLHVNTNMYETNAGTGGFV
jgi:hypothetical protein